MKHLRITVGALLLALFASLASVAPALATVDGGVCSSSDTGGTGCTFTQLKPNLNEEVNNLNGRTKLLLTSVTGTNTITACATPAVTSYVSGQPFELKPAAANTSSVTLNVCSIGAKALTDSAGNALTSGNLLSTTIYNVVYFAANDQFRVLSPLSGSGVGLTSNDIDTSSELDAIVTDDTGTGALVFANSPTLVTPALGTPASGTLTNATGLPIATGVSGLGSGVATALATPSSANLATALTDETGTGAAVFGTTPTFTTSMVAMGDTISDFTGFGMALSSGSLGLLTTGALDGECLAYESTGPTIDWVTCGGGGGGSLSDGDYGDITVSSSGTVLSVDSGAVTATEIASTASGNIAATNAEAAIDELDSEKAGLATANTFTNANNFTSTSTGQEGIAATLTDAGAAEWVGLFLDRNSATPAASDYINSIWFNGRDSAANSQLYGAIAQQIVDQTTANEDGRTEFYATSAGNVNSRAMVLENTSIAVGSLAVQGGASVNASNYFDDNVNINTLYQGIDGDLTALAGQAGTGLYAVTGAGTGATRTLTAPAAGITVTNGNGVSGNPTLALADDLAAYEGLAANGIVARTGTGTASARTITGTSNEITVTNGDGVSGNPTLSLPSAITLTGKTVTGLTSTSGGITVNGATSGSTVIAATGVASGTLTLPAATDTLVGKATTDTLTNKTISGASNTLSNIATTSLTGTLQAGQFPALTGDVTTVAGALASTIAADAVALTTDTTGNYVGSVADGTGIDGTASGEGATYTPSLDLTEVNSATWGAGSFTGFTFDAGAVDIAMALSSGELQFNAGGTSPIIGIDDGGDLRFYEEDAGGSNYMRLIGPATMAANFDCQIQSDGRIPDSCVGDGNDAGSGAGSGDVVGPASATDNAITRYDGTTGKIVQDSGVTISDGGEILAVAGTATEAPIKLQAGTNLTTAEDGAIEMDGEAIYATTDAGNRGAVRVVNYIAQDSTRTLTSNTTEQAIFDETTNGRITLETGLYRFECQLSMGSMSATSGNASFDLMGTGNATLGRIAYTVAGNDAAAGATGSAVGGSHNTAAQTGASMVTAATGTALGANIRGSFRVTAGGTLVPSVTLVTAAAATVLAGSYCGFERMGGSATSVGQWD